MEKEPIYFIGVIKNFYIVFCFKLREEIRLIRKTQKQRILKRYFRNFKSLVVIRELEDGNLPFLFSCLTEISSSVVNKNYNFYLILGILLIICTAEVMVAFGYSAKICLQCRLSALNHNDKNVL